MRMNSMEVLLRELLGAKDALEQQLSAEVERANQERALSEHLEAENATLRDRLDERREAARSASPIVP